MDSRGEGLMVDVFRAEEDETMPKAVHVLYSRGLFSKKVVGRGTEAGRATTAADFEELMQPITETEWNATNHFRRQTKKCS